MSDLIEPMILRAEHMPGARLFADRVEMIRHFARPTRRVGEVGVALGDFSKALIAAFKPATFVGIDLFDLHESGSVWGRSREEVFGTGTHRDYYVKKLTGLGPAIEIGEGMSHERLAEQPDQSFDVLYIDGDHSFAQVDRDARQAVRKIKPDGLLIFNDYILQEPFTHQPYGVVQVVNTLIADGGWQMQGLALQQYMFCDVALARPAAVSRLKRLFGRGAGTRARPPGT